MRIKELIIDGFKSYHTRTTITGWDPSFNAITGLNGSGKSNILDAICFVLGMTNVTSMRAQNLQDLIYKRGQAGIHRASVTIVFDNTDRATSPVSFENTPEITVMRQISMPNINKYLLNGHKAQQQTIQTLFQSVQLNINNPHFLIMQGRITKVLNMRPQEILGMVEEAAGTRMFEERKDKAKKTMGKKEKKVQEITTLLEEEITPKLDTLRAEKRAYLQWQKACSELERVGRVLRAYEWTEAKQRVASKEQEMKHKEKEVASFKRKRIQYEHEIQVAEADVERAKTQRDKELKKGGKFTKLQEEVTEFEKALVKMRTQVDLKNGSIKEEEDAAANLQEELQQAEAALESKRVIVAELEAAHAKVRDEHEQLQAELSSAEELLQTLLTGLSSSNKNQSGGGYLGQLAAARQREAQGQAEETQARQRLGMVEKSLQEAQTRWKAVEREAGEGKKKLEKMRKEVEDLRRRVERTGWSAEKEKESEEALRAARDEARKLTEQRDMTKQRLSFLDFNYADPMPDFDRSKVKGLVANLITLNQENYNKATALEITAGGRLYNVVVENEKVGKDLLEKGRLKKRVTIIPLNKISAHKLSNQKMQAAHRIAGDKVRTALSLVGYPEEVSAAMAYVFGETLICDDTESAKAVTFSREVGVKSVTLQGDIYDPSGTLSGGAPPSSNKALVSVQELLDIERKLGAAMERLRALEQEEARNKAARESWKALAHELDLKEHEMRLLEEQVGGSNASKAATDIETLKANVQELQAAVQAAIDKQRASKEEIKKLEKDMAEFKNNKEGKIEQLKSDVSKQKTTLQKHSTTLKLKHKDAQTAKLELESMENDISTAKEQIEQARHGIEKLKQELAKLMEQVKVTETKHAKALRNLQDEQATLTRFDNELKDLEGTIKAKKAAISDADLQLKQLEHDIQQLGKDRTSAFHAVENLEKQYDWIEDEQDNFGKPGSQYDFSALDVPRLRERARELENTQKGLKRKVNPKAVAMLESVEKQEASLKKMLTTVLGDKEKIEQTIEELDRYKRDALEKTWTKVNGDFGSIFAELLPGNFAKLQPPEGQDLTDGLEVKVRLGSVWKQSLTELSGGQRSLIALSLIMSLLQFKPAPMYILDEIDAALDLSHTQHIGQLFRNRFKGSQFIVVSLKEGLFTNANVLFRTRFRDGTSIVERTADRSTSTIYDSNQANNDDRRRRRGGAA